jgi:hypothetical protein
MAQLLDLSKPLFKAFQQQQQYR